MKLALLIEVIGGWKYGESWWEFESGEIWKDKEYWGCRESGKAGTIHCVTVEVAKQ